MKKADKDIFLRYLGQTIRQFRIERGMTQEQLAISSGYKGETARSTMSKIERGKVDLPISKIHDIAKALDMSTWGLINEADWRMS
jgi:transcriptional regulator with XRE-family HTH domain